MAQLESVFPTSESARETLDGLIKQVVAHPNVTIYTLAELVGMKGYVGDFQATIRQQSRGISDELAEAAMAACSARPVYGRVDMVRGDDGRLLVMELELVEPELWYRMHPPAAEAFAEALVRWLG